MEAIASVTGLFASVALGLMAGALLAEGAILVRFWRSMQPEAFLGWYKEHAALLQKFFGPLEVAAAVLTIVAATLSRSSLLIVSALLAVAVLAVFPLYFQRANTSFAKGTIAATRVAEELRRWAAWHWSRTVMAVAAFLAAVVAV